ncbi:ABC transporter substrate-binding protein [Jeotgalibacillus campisalis]|uniref:Ferrichrome ABC transporter substrate-binding protein n=1 Tax=Jeotgalibacillus campisalis TaxID=220754 RepID=A0A0C2RFY1_9BACL|nr:ABC transporter substrate-binding protein [Jeotgalibacillus campisalis]KIL49070.1 ferrichrome ABC transporter substrate-binding protein [Jeotgalibacillus campisalis]
MNRLKKRSLYFTPLLSIALILGACSNSDENNTGTETDENTDSEQATEVTLEDATGEVTIPADAERIIAPYMEDSLLSLDITPAAQWAIGTSVLDYLQDDLADVPTIEWNLPLEMTIEADPDLLIFSSEAAMSEGSADDYKEIAPTYVFTDEEGADWRKQIDVIATLTQNEEKAEEVLADYEDTAAEAADQVNEMIGDESAAMVWVMGDQFYIFEEQRHAANVLYGDLGISVPSFISDLGETESAWNPISLEAMADLDADHLFLISAEEEAGLARLQDSSLWQGLPAVQNDQVYNITDSSHWNLTGNLANRKTIEDVLAEFGS